MVAMLAILMAILGLELVDWQWQSAWQKNLVRGILAVSFYLYFNNAFN